MKRLLSGNEAIALGAFEGDVRYAAAYPGTPSTEVLANSVLLGALSCHIQAIDPDVWTTVIQRRVPKKYAELNRVAFWEGRM